MMNLQELWSERQKLVDAALPGELNQSAAGSDFVGSYGI